MLTALNRKNGAFNTKNSGIEPEKERRLTRKIAALNRKKSGVNSV